MPKPDIPIVTSKIEGWKARKEDYDTVFIGDSRIYQNLSPDVFDICAARSGEKTNSYNMGIPAMSIGEMRTIIQEILQEKPSQLRYVIILPSHHWLGKISTKRAIFFHNLSQTIFSLQYTLNSDLNILRKGKYTLKTLASFSLNFLNVGVLSDWLQTQSNQKVIETIKINDGYQPFDSKNEAKTNPRHQNFIKQTAHLDFEKWVKNNYITKNNNPPEFGNNYYKDVVQEIHHNFEKNQILPVYLAPPKSWGKELEDSLLETLILTHQQNNLLDPFLNYSNPYQYPEYLNRHLLLDADHLSYEGAEIFSCQVAQDFVSIIKNRRNK